MSDDLRKLAEAALAEERAELRKPATVMEAFRARQEFSITANPTAILALLDRVERLERAVAGVFANWESSDGDGDYVLFQLRAALEVDRE